MKDRYYSERRAVSREMRRAAERRKMGVVAAVGCILVAVVLAIVTIVDVADAGETKQAEIERFESAKVELESIKSDVVVSERVEAVLFDYTPVDTIIPVQNPKKEVNVNNKYNKAELEMLALVIYQEAGGDACSDSTRRMVGEVVLNRIDHPVYPNTMEEVLTQYGQYGRLHWTGLVWPERAKYEVERHAVERAYRIAEELLTSDYRILPGDVLFQAEFPQGSEIVVEQEGLYFCR